MARAANVGVNSVNRFETGRDSRISTVEKLRSAFEAAGVMFIVENGGGAGVRFRETKARKQTEGLRRLLVKRGFLLRALGFLSRVRLQIAQLLGVQGAGRAPAKQAKWR